MPSQGFKISDFKSNIQNNGVLQTNKFLVEILDFNRNLTNLQLDTSNISELMKFRAESVNIPGVSLDTLSTRRYGIGPTQKIAQGVNFPDISISFIDDAKNSVWKYLYGWLNYIFQFTGSSNKPAYTLKWKNEYVVDILIHVYDNEGKEVTTIKLKEAFPTNLNDIGLSWSETNNLLRTTASFSYTEWEEVIVATKIKPDNNINFLHPIPQSVTTPTPSFPTTPILFNNSINSQNQDGSYVGGIGLPVDQPVYQSGA